MSPQGSRRDVAYTAKTHILPTQHLLILHDQNRKKIDNASVSSWVRDYAFFLLDTEPDLRLLLGRGAPLWPTKDTEMMGHHISWLYPAEDDLRITLLRELKRAAAESHFGNEDWQIKKDGSRFRGNVHTVALKTEQGELQGFARVVRDLYRASDESRMGTSSISAAIASRLRPQLAHKVKRTWATFR